MKVLMIVTRLNIGGTETYVLSMAQALRASGVEVGIATTGGPMVATCHRLGIPVHLIPEHSTRTPLAYASALAPILIANAYQIVHAHDTRSFRAMKPLLQAHPVRVVLTIHGTYFHKLLIKSVAQQSQVVISVSPTLSNWIRSCGVPDAKITVIPNGIDIAHYSPVAQQAPARQALQLPQQGTIIAYAARFSKDKQSIARQIILAGEQINRTHPQVTTVLAGPGPYRAALSQLAVEANKRLGRQAILVRPAITNIRALYRAADIVIGTGRVALEAMACGKPVLAAGVKGYLGLVTPQHIEKAIACHFGDHAANAKLTVPALKNDMTRMLKKPELTQSLSKFGRQLVVQRFSISQVAKKLKSIYETGLISQPKEAQIQRKPLNQPKTSNRPKPLNRPKTSNQPKPSNRLKPSNQSTPQNQSDSSNGTVMWYNHKGIW